MKRKSITDFFSTAASPKKIKQEQLLSSSSAENPILIDDDSNENSNENTIINSSNDNIIEIMNEKKVASSTPKEYKFTYILNEKDTGVQVRYIERFLSQRESKELFDCLMEKCEWISPKYNMYGNDVVSKRKVAFFGKPIEKKVSNGSESESVSRVYNGLVKLQTDWPEPLLNLKKKLEELIGEKYEAALINRYDDGDDLIGWHADREASGFSIASVSLGASRDFQLRPIPKQYTSQSTTSQQQPSPIKKKGEIITKSLENGCLLIMNGATQKHYQHCVPKRKGVLSARLNITFRDLNAYGNQN